MAAEVEVQTGEVGRTMVGGRLRLSPLADSSNSLIGQSHLITPEPSKPVPAPKPRLTPKPFAVDKNLTVKPIVAPKPLQRPRSESTHLPGPKLPTPCSPKPPQPSVKAVPSDPEWPASTSFKPSNKMHLGQTTKPVIQPFKPAPPLASGDLNEPIKKLKPSSLAHSHSLKKPSAAEWSGNKISVAEKERSITRAKSMGFLTEVGKEEEDKAEADVALRPQPRTSRPRPASELFLHSPAKASAPAQGFPWAGRRPLSADLTARFESIGLSLHRKFPTMKENAPEEKGPPPERESETACPEGGRASTVSEQSGKKEAGEERRADGVRSRISHLLDSPPMFLESDPPATTQAGPNAEPAVGVRQLIRQLTEDTPPAQSPIARPPMKPRPLPLDLTKRFSSERSPDLAAHTAERHDITSTDAQRGIGEAAATPSDQAVIGDQEESQERKMAPPLSVSEKGQSLSSDVQRVRLFENVVEKHNVLLMDDGQFAQRPRASHGHPSIKRGRSEDEGTLFTATYVDSVSPSSPMRAAHAFDTIKMEENRAVSENLPSAQREDKAMTLRSRRSEGKAAEQPRYLRVGALQKWTAGGLEQEPTGEPVEVTAKQQKMLQTEEQPKAKATYFALTGKNKELLLSPAEEPKFLTVTTPEKIPQVGRNLLPNELFGQTSDGPKESQMELQKKNAKMKELEKEKQRQLKVEQEAFMEFELQRKKMMEKQEFEEKQRALRRLKQLELERQHAEKEKQRQREEERQREMQRMKELEMQRQREMEMQRQKEMEMQRQKEMEMQRQKEMEMQRQKEMEMQRQKEMEMQRQKEMEMQRQKEMETQRQREMEMQRQKEMEMQRQKEMETQRQREMEMQRQKEMEMQRQKEMETQRQKEMEMQRQKEMEMQRQKEMETQRQREMEMQRQKEMEMQRQKEMEMQRQREMEMQRQREMEMQRQREMEMQRQKEMEMQRQREMETQRQREMEMQRQKEMEMQRQREMEMQRQREMEMQRQRELEVQRQKELDKERMLLEMQKEKQRLDDLERQRERQQQLELEKKQLRERKLQEEAEKLKKMAIEQEMLRMMEIEKEKERQREIEREHQREVERQKQRQLEREHQKQLDMERQEMEKQRLRQREQEKEKKRLEEMERLKEMEKRHLLEFEKQKQAERAEQERQRLREEVQKVRRRQQELEDRQQLKAPALRPTVVDLDSVHRNEHLHKAATRWKEPTGYKPAILDIDAFSSQNKDSLPAFDSSFGAKPQTTPERDISWKVPSQTAVAWTLSPQDPWELQPVEMSVDTPLIQPGKQGNNPRPDQLLSKHEERLQVPQRNRSTLLDENLLLGPFGGTDGRSQVTQSGISPAITSGSTAAELDWLPRELQPQQGWGQVQVHRRSQGSQELNRLRSRSMSRRSAPPGSAVEVSLSRMRSRSAHREHERHSMVQQKKSESEDAGETLGHDTDSQYGTWETGLRTDDSLSPLTPSSDSHQSPSPRKATPPHTPADSAHCLENDTVKAVLSSVSPDIQQAAFPDAPPTLLDTSALRSRAQLAKKRAPRTRPSRAARKSNVLVVGDAPEDWLFRDSTETKVAHRDSGSDSEELTRGPDSGPAVSSQPPRVALFPGVDASALKAQLKKRVDSDNHNDGPAVLQSQPSRSPKSPFLPRAARVLPPAGGKENGEEDSPQWLKELKSKKRLSQYDGES